MAGSKHPPTELEQYPRVRRKRWGSAQWKQLRTALSPVRFLRLLRRLMPTPGGMIMLGLWLALAAVSCDVLGAFLIDRGRPAWQVFTLVAGLAVGLPVFIAPRPGWEPAGWGVALNVFILAALALLARPTEKALQGHGDWAVRWLEARGSDPAVVSIARQVDALARWGLSQVPIEQLEQQFGRWDDTSNLTSQFSGITAVAIDAGTSSAPAGGVLSASRDAGASGAPTGAGGAQAPNAIQISSAPDQLPTDPNDPYWGKLAASPDSVTLDRQEQRLLQLINLERNKRGLSTLQIRDDLCRVARAHTEAMLTQKFFSHIDPQGRNPDQRIQAGGLEATHVIELIGKVGVEAHSDIARDMTNAFLRTPADRDKLLAEETEYLAMGVGLACDGPVCLGTVLFLP